MMLERQPYPVRAAACVLAMALYKDEHALYFVECRGKMTQPVQKRDADGNLLGDASESESDYDSDDSDAVAEAEQRAQKKRDDAEDAAKPVGGNAGKVMHCFGKMVGIVQLREQALAALGHFGAHPDVTPVAAADAPLTNHLVRQLEKTKLRDAFGGNLARVLLLFGQDKVVETYKSKLDAADREAIDEVLMERQKERDYMILDSITSLFNEKEIAKYRKVFSKVDLDGSGSISTDEMGALFKSLGEELSPGRLKVVINQVGGGGAAAMSRAITTASNSPPHLLTSSPPHLPRSTWTGRGRLSSTSSCWPCTTSSPRPAAGPLAMSLAEPPSASSQTSSGASSPAGWAPGSTGGRCATRARRPSGRGTKPRARGRRPSTGSVRGCASRGCAARRRATGASAATRSSSRPTRTATAR